MVRFSRRHRTNGAEAPARRVRVKSMSQNSDMRIRCGHALSVTSPPIAAMKALQALVIGMGILIFVALGLVAYGITRDAAPRQSPAAFGQTEVALPAGARILDMVAVAGRVVLRLETVDGAQRLAQQLIVIDPVTGRKLGTVDLAAPR